MLKGKIEGQMCWVIREGRRHVFEILLEILFRHREHSFPGRRRRRSDHLEEIWNAQGMGDNGDRLCPSGMQSIWISQNFGPLGRQNLTYFTTTT